MPDSPLSKEEIDALNRAKDLSAQVGQGHARLVQSADGNVYLCRSGLPDSTMDIEPHPMRQHANSMIPFAVKNSEGQRHALLSRLDAEQAAFPPQTVFHLNDAGEMVVTPMPGVLAGLNPTHSFQVIYASENRWMVGAGKIQVSGVTVKAFENTVVKKAAGWICVKALWSIEGINDYYLEKAELVSAESLTAPAGKWTVDDNNALQPPQTAIVLHPLAFVDWNPGKRPVIQQLQTTDLIFRPSLSGWGLLGPRTSAL